MAITPHQLDSLFIAARDATQRAYAPYSSFTVGCALLLPDGNIITGCNVENASFSVTLCAERVAASTAIAAGQCRWLAIVVVSPTGVSPCGACRQFLAEFEPKLPIYFGAVNSSSRELVATTLDQLLPSQMKLKTLAREDFAEG